MYIYFNPSELGLAQLTRHYMTEWYGGTWILRENIDGWTVYKLGV